MNDDPSRGTEVDDSFTLLYLLLTIFAWAVSLSEVVLWPTAVLDQSFERALH
ncbi:hypothetical protein ACIP2Y_43645 [Streptomyces sviceus]|uniref:hypothetical protein n=1 Tax=Streptomyces sviceus TaxID=285530 RepID=UPI00380BB35A